MQESHAQDTKKILKKESSEFENEKNLILFLLLFKKPAVVVAAFVIFFHLTNKKKQLKSFIFFKDSTWNKIYTSKHLQKVWKTPVKSVLKFMIPQDQVNFFLETQQNKNISFFFVSYRQTTKWPSNHLTDGFTFETRNVNKLHNRRVILVDKGANKEKQRREYFLKKGRDKKVQVIFPAQFAKDVLKVNQCICMLYEDLNNSRTFWKLFFQTYSNRDIKNFVKSQQIKSREHFAIIQLNVHKNMYRNWRK